MNGNELQHSIMLQLVHDLQADIMNLRQQLAELSQMLNNERAKNVQLEQSLKES